MTDKEKLKLALEAMKRARWYLRSTLTDVSGAIKALEYAIRKIEEDETHD